MTDAEADAVVEAHLDGVRWLRCACCGQIGDAADDDHDHGEWRITVEDGAVVAVLCTECKDP